MAAADAPTSCSADLQQGDDSKSLRDAQLLYQVVHVSPDSRKVCPDQKQSSDIAASHHNPRYSLPINPSVSGCRLMRERSDKIPSALRGESLCSFMLLHFAIAALPIAIAIFSETYHGSKYSAIL